MSLETTSPTRPPGRSARSAAPPGEATPPLRAASGTLPGGDLLAVAARRPALPQIAWTDSESGELHLGLGAAREWSARGSDARRLPGTIQAALGEVEAAVSPRIGRDRLRVFGGIPFDPTTPPHPDWPAGAGARFVLPRIHLRQREPGGEIEWTLLLRRGEDGGEERRWIDSVREAAGSGGGPARPTGPIRMRRIARDRDRAHWRQAVEGALERIGSKGLRKVVLSRDLRHEAAAPIDPWDLFGRILDRRPHGQQFCVRFDEGSAFLGAPPERLFGLADGSVRCDCLAGTAAADAPEEEASRAGLCLLASEKERREHRLVLEGIVEALLPLVRWLEHPAVPELLRLPRIQHLSSPVRGRLRDRVGPGLLLTRLAPTAAVGGSPREEAVRLIRAIEPRPRGWYAGSIGWISSEAADFAVGIRSAILAGRRIVVVGGAGIVAGSDPDGEWEETARKADSFLSLFAEIE